MSNRPHLRQRLGSDALRILNDATIPPTDPSADSSTSADPPINLDSPLASPSASRPRSSSISTIANGSAAFSHHRNRSNLYSPLAMTAVQADQKDQKRLSVPLSPHATSALSIPNTPTSPANDDLTPVGKTISRHDAYAPTMVPTWSNMPNKHQLAILCLSRFVDFFQMASLQTYMVHQLKSFDLDLPDADISHQAGVLQGSFTAAQIVTSILWGRLADRPTVGRKLVLNIGLVGCGISMLGVGFSSSYRQAVFWRVLGGAINGTVGSARTMVAETVDKRWHPRAFLLLPAAFNVANVAGPILGGLLVDPVAGFPAWFGENSTFGGPDGVAWMRTYPYALANMLSTVLLFGEALLVTLFLKETLRGYKGTDWAALTPWTVIGAVRDSVRGLRRQGVRAFNETAMLKRGLLSAREDASVELDRAAHAVEMQDLGGGGRQHAAPRLPFRRIWTSNVLWTLASIAIFDFHMGAFNNLWVLFLSTSRAFDPAHQPRSVSPFKFSGGLAFPPPTIGFAMAILGFIGVALQFILYPWANGRFGLMRCFRASLFLFPLAYALAPYIALLPSPTAYPEPATGAWVWTGIFFVLTLQVTARTFALPASILLTNNASPHPSVLATIHGLGQADSATFRTIGPVLAGGWFGTWRERGVVGMAWWIVAAVSALGCVASFYVRNGSGHEIFLEGEEELAAAAGKSVASGEGRRREEGGPAGGR